eukprot:scaffold1374_cov115-Isochrysis_galbana.AAC.7
MSGDRPSDALYSIPVSTVRGTRGMIHACAIAIALGGGRAQELLNNRLPCSKRCEERETGGSSAKEKKGRGASPTSRGPHRHFDAGAPAPAAAHGATMALSTASALQCSISIPESLFRLAYRLAAVHARGARTMRGPPQGQEAMRNVHRRPAAPPKHRTKEAGTQTPGVQAQPQAQAGAQGQGQGGAARRSTG